MLAEVLFSVNDEISKRANYSTSHESLALPYFKLRYLFK